MKTSDIRRENLKSWFATRSIPSSEKSYISQLITGKASFGEKAARRLESTYGMPAGFLDELLQNSEQKLYDTVTSTHKVQDSGQTIYTTKTNSYAKDILRIMDTLDDRGQLKIKLLVEDEAARHKKLMEDAAPNLDVQLLNEVLKHGSKTQRDIINSAISSMTAEYLQQIKKAG